MRSGEVHRDLITGGVSRVDGDEAPVAKGLPTEATLVMGSETAQPLSDPGLASTSRVTLPNCSFLDQAATRSPPATPDPAENFSQKQARPAKESQCVDVHGRHSQVWFVAYKLSLLNGLARPIRLRFEPYLIADWQGHHDYDMPPAARWSILGPNREVELEIGINTDSDFITILVTGCNVNDITVIDSTTGDAPALADGPPPWLT